MSLTTGTKLGPYEILSPLGKGGMGEVFRAKDTRLERDVAIKVLPSIFSANAELKQRFEREAKAISNLSHPNICTLYDVGCDNGVDYLVMEFLDGDTLAQRLRKGPLPADEVWKVGAEIASAMDKAHRAGVIHRDIKPGNIMLTKSGAKLLDFGLAKHAPGQSDMASAPDAATMTEPLTGKGTIVGTFQYMAPEQLEGKEADARTDIFAFGAVLYEMATGTRAFSGKSRASLITSIMSASPRPISEVQPMTPPALEQVVKTCLAKDPDDRIQTAHDVKLQLQWLAEGGSQVGAAVSGVARKSKGERRAWQLTGLALAIAAAALSWAVWHGPTPDARVIFANLSPPSDAGFAYRSGPPALSPDARFIVFVGRDEDKTRRLWLRAFDLPRARRLVGTEGASNPFWSPNSRAIGFFADGKLKRIDTSGGFSNILCDAPKGEANGGTWNKDNVILFAQSQNRGLMRVSASGGTPEEVLSLDTAQNEFAQRHPCFLPDGKHFLYSSRQGVAGGNGVMVASLEGDPPRRLLDVSSNAVFARPGFVLYWHDDALRARPFDADKLEFTGDSVVVAPGVRLEPDGGVAHFTVSAQGTLAYHTGGTATVKSQLVLYDRDGKVKGTAGDPGNYYAPRLSHDGTRVAVDNSGVQNNGDIWIHDIERSMASRVSSDPADESDPIWSPNDDTIVFDSAKAGDRGLYIKALGSAVPAEQLIESGRDDESLDWSSDGKYIVFARDSLQGSCKDLWLLSVEDKSITAITNTPCPFDEFDARISPDGKWLAYSSDESGRSEIYIQAFPEPGIRRQISLSGGTGPRWQADGKELVYVAPDGMIMSAGLGDDPTRETATITPLFKITRRFEDHAGDFDMTLDGKTFLVNEPLESPGTSALTLQLNWLERLENR